MRRMTHSCVAAGVRRADAEERRRRRPRGHEGPACQGVHILVTTPAVQYKLVLFCVVLLAIGF